MSDVFEKWLIEYEFKSLHTAYQYSRAINRLSRHYSGHTQNAIDLYALQDLKALQQIALLYGASGKFSEYGHNGNGTHRAAIKSLCRFRENTQNATYAPSSFQQQEKSQQYEYEAPAYGFSKKQDLKRAVIDQVGQLFPEYYFLGSREEGVDYSLGAHLLDVLLEKEDGSLLAIEIIPGLATSEAFGRFSLLLGLLLDNFPERRVRGCIIAGEIDKSLRSAARTSEYIALNTYTLGIKLQPGYLAPDSLRNPSRSSIFRSLFWF